MAEALGGRAQAMDALIRRLKPEILKVSRLLSSDQDEVNVLAERIFLRVFRSLNCHGPGRPLAEWSVHSAVAVGLHEARNLGEGADVQDWTNDDVELLRAVDEGRSQVSPAEAAGLFNRLLDRLTPAERLVKRLLDLEGNSVDEVCRWTGWSEAKVERLAESAGRRVDEMLGIMCGDGHAESHQLKH